MERYRNLSGDSGVASFEMGPDFIRVQFTDNHVYLYNNAATGEANISRMKALAVQGKGLNTFINQEVKHEYAVKER